MCVCVTICVYCICAYGYSAVNTLFVYSACVWECVYAYVCVLHLCAWILAVNTLLSIARVYVYVYVYVYQE